MTEAQVQTVTTLLAAFNAKEVVHGDCIGADATLHELARYWDLGITIRPCNISSQRAYSKGAHATFPAIDPLDRNKKIVDSSDVMIACPSGYSEEIRSGTWATIRYAKRTKKELWIVYPDGKAAKA